MTESEAIEIVQKEKAYMDSHAGRAQSEAFSLAIKALEKIDKINKVLNTTCLSDDVSKCYYDGDCRLHEYNEIVKIIRSDEVNESNRNCK